MSLADIDETRDIDQQRDVIKDTAAMVFAGISLQLQLACHLKILSFFNFMDAAGSDTTLSAIHTFFLAMICFPEVQMKAQAELDRVVSGRLPDFDDMEELPYLSAIIKEVLRLVALNMKVKMPTINFPLLHSDGNPSRRVVRLYTYQCLRLY